MKKIQLRNKTARTFIADLEHLPKDEHQVLRSGPAGLQYAVYKTYHQVSIPAFGISESFSEDILKNVGVSSAINLGYLQVIKI
jgi:hypothetical protein